MNYSAGLSPEEIAELVRREGLTTSQRATIAAQLWIDSKSKKEKKRMTNVVHIKGSKEAPKAQRSSMETIIVSVEQVNQWRVPPFQRPIRVNAKVGAMADEIKRDGVSLPGVITLGKLSRDSTLYVVDGQHRLEAFRISGLQEVIVDVRIIQFDNMGEMADEFVGLNSKLVNMRPDDILRGLEPTLPQLQRIREECEFVGYDNIRRNATGSPVVGMSSIIRCWTSSAAETPSGNMVGGRSIVGAASDMDEASTGHMIKFLQLARIAWGRDPEYFRLWSNLNLTICMWLWRRLVLDKERGVKRAIVLSEAQFKQCLMSVSADPNYVDWLHRRVLSDRDRGPAYAKLRTIFSRRLISEGVVRPMLPSPAWVSK